MAIKKSNLSRQNMKIPPNNGQGDVWAGQKIILTLWQNAMIDLSTLTMDFKGSDGKLGPTGYCQSWFFPRQLKVWLRY